MDITTSRLSIIASSSVCAFTAFTSTPEETDRMVSSPVARACSCSDWLVLISTPAATAATMTMAMNIMSVPIPTSPFLSFLSFLILSYMLFSPPMSAHFCKFTFSKLFFT